MWFRKEPEARLDKELRYHFDKLVRDFIAEGVDPQEAKRRTRLEFGGLEQIKEEVRDVRGRWLQDFAGDLRYVARALLRSPGFLAISVLSLALGIGANTAIFSLIDAVMLRWLPVQEPERLVQIARLSEAGKPTRVSYPLFEHLRDHLKSISGAAAELAMNPAIVMDGTEEVVDAEAVSGGHFPMLRMQPAAGRLLDPSDDQVVPASPAAVISYRYWQRRFTLDPAAIGKTFSMRNRLFTIVGVTPPGFTGTRQGEDPDITFTLAMMLSDEQRGEATNNFLSMLGRLKAGVTQAQANAELQVVWQPFLQSVAAREREKDRAAMLRQRIGMVSGAVGFSNMREQYAEALLVLMGIVALVLLLACANLSGLLLARAASRQREISIRLAIGAGRGRLVRQFLAESFVLAALGGGLGLLLARWFSAVLVVMLANERTRLSTAPDWRVLVFTAGVSLLACVLAGLAPGLHALRANLNPGLKETRAGGRRGLGRGLVIAQLSLSMVLVVGATLFVATLINLSRVDRGMRTDGILMFSLRAHDQYPQARTWEIQKDLLERIRRVPGVASASVVSVLPISGSLWARNVQVEGYHFGAEENETSAFNAVAPKYFETVGTPLVGGRDFDQRDTDTSSKVTIVSESFARYFFGDRSPLGKRVTSVNVTYEIVGVVRDTKYQGLRQGVPKTMYIPLQQRAGESVTGFHFLARAAAGNPALLVPSIETAVRASDPGLRLRSAQTYSSVVDRTIVTERVMATLGGFFGLLALVVACLGIFGLMAFQISRRINELGLRMALGASRGGIVTLVLRDVAWMFAAGSAIGGVAALTLTGLARKILFGVSPTEPGVFVVSALVLGVAALAAGSLPAIRASRIDPMAALRHD